MRHSGKQIFYKNFTVTVAYRLLYISLAPEFLPVSAMERHCLTHHSPEPRARHGIIGPREIFVFVNSTLEKGVTATKLDKTRQTERTRKEDRKEKCCLDKGSNLHL